MTYNDKTALNIVAPAKVNLCLHITGKREDGYHLLESLIGFTTFGDRIRIKAAEVFTLNITGPFASEVDINHNSVTQVMAVLESHAGRHFPIEVSLDKQIPVGAGLGGGSSDAAQILIHLPNYLGLRLKNPLLKTMAESIGADVLACMEPSYAIMSGIGETIESLPITTKLPILLVYPNIPLATEKVYKQSVEVFDNPLPRPIPDNSAAMIDYLSFLSNSLTKPGTTLLPEIKTILHTISMLPACRLSRMTGSGSCCFGLFDSTEEAERALILLAKDFPQWWTKVTVISSAIL